MRFVHLNKCGLTHHTRSAFKQDDYYNEPFLYYFSVFFTLSFANSHINHVLWKQLTCTNASTKMC